MSEISHTMPVPFPEQDAENDRISNEEREKILNPESRKDEVAKKVEMAKQIDKEFADRLKPKEPVKEIRTMPFIAPSKED